MRISSGLGSLSSHWLGPLCSDFSPKFLPPTLWSLFVRRYYVAYFYVTLPFLPCYSSPHLSFHTRSSAHPSVARLHLIMSTYHMRSTTHPGVSCLFLIIPTSRSSSLPSPGPYCVTLPSCVLRLLDSRKYNSRIAQSCLSPPPWRYHASLLRPPPP